MEEFHPVLVHWSATATGTQREMGEILYRDCQRFAGDGIEKGLEEENSKVLTGSTMPGTPRVTDCSNGCMAHCVTIPLPAEKPPKIRAGGGMRAVGELEGGWQRAAEITSRCPPDR